MKYRRFISVLTVLGLTLWSNALPAAYALSTASAPEKSKPILQYVIAAAMAGLCVLILFKNAKRTPQD